MPLKMPPSTVLTKFMRARILYNAAQEVIKITTDKIVNSGKTTGDKLVLMDSYLKDPTSTSEIHRSNVIQANATLFAWFDEESISRKDKIKYHEEIERLIKLIEDALQKKAEEQSDDRSITSNICTNEDLKKLIADIRDTIKSSDPKLMATKLQSQRDTEPSCNIL